jgi:DNA repair protein RadC
LISIKAWHRWPTYQGFEFAVGVAEMIALDDCLAMCGLSEEEVLAIAEHEHIPEIAAAALAQYLLNSEHGPEKIRDMIRDDIRQALARHDREHAGKLFMALRHFLSEHQTCSRHVSESCNRTPECANER